MVQSSFFIKRYAFACKVKNSVNAYQLYSGAIAKWSRACVHSGFCGRGPGFESRLRKFFSKKNLLDGGLS